jgi:hypothetical protein
VIGSQHSDAEATANTRFVRLTLASLDNPSTEAWSMPDAVLKLLEVAGILKVPEKPIHAMLQAGNFRAFRVRGQWRFKQNNNGFGIDEQKAEVKGKAAKELPIV